MLRVPWRANHACEQPCRMVVYDTETTWYHPENNATTQIHRFRLGCAALWTRRDSTWTRRDDIAFDNPGRFWDWLYLHTRQREPLWVYAHNAAFDATTTGLWDQLDNGNLSIKTAGNYYRDSTSGELRKGKDWQGWLSVDNLPFIVVAKHGKCTIKFADTMNYLPVCLEKIGAWVGLDKVALPENDDDDSLWYQRCWGDVKITERAVLKLMGLWSGRKLGNWQMTTAGLAFSSFRHVTPKSGIVAHGDDPAEPEDMAADWIAGREPRLDALDISRLERRAFYGARVLVNFVGDVVPAESLGVSADMFGERCSRPREIGPVTIFDVNGLYAYIMATYNGPVEFMDAQTDLDPAAAYATAKMFPCIARVRISGRTAAYPLRDNYRTVHARGMFVTELAGPELLRAFENGHVEQVHQMSVYHRGQPFAEYVMYWWNMRLAAIKADDKCTATLCKLMINALYGKLGQRLPLWALSSLQTVPARWGAFVADAGDGLGLRKFRAVAGVAQEVSDRRDCRHTFTAAAAWITSAARMFMENLRWALPDRSVIYQDTDSLFVLPSGREALYNSGMVHPTALGKLKDQGTFEYLSVFGPKNYMKGGQDVVAGLRSRREVIGERQWKQWYFERCQSIISRKPDGTIRSWQEVFKAAGATCGYDVAADGWTTPVRVFR